MDLQLKWIINLLEEEGINYFIDNGTLLGIIRDGALIKWDKDIDITILDNYKKINNFIKKMEKTKYHVSKSRFNEKITRISICPNNFYHKFLYPYIPKKKIEGNRKIDIDILFQKNNFFWTPILFSKGSDKRGIIFLYYKLIRGMVRILKKIFPNQKFLKKLTRKTDKAFYKQGTVIIPKKYLKKTKKINGIRVPENEKEYLNYRYGNWKKPVKNWSYIRDDGAMRTQSPKELGLI
jgi:phosphorylcholine metabolism protein LicD